MSLSQWSTTAWQEHSKMQTAARSPSTKFCQIYMQGYIQLLLASPLSSPGSTDSDTAAFRHRGATEKKKYRQPWNRTGQRRGGDGWMEQADPAILVLWCCSHVGLSSEEAGKMHSQSLLHSVASGTHHPYCPSSSLPRQQHLWPNWLFMMATAAVGFRALLIGGFCHAHVQQVA